MKRNLLPVLLLIAAGNTYALQIEGGKLLRHHEFIAPNTKLTFKQSKTTSQTILKTKMGVLPGIDPAVNPTVNIMNSLADINVGGGFQGGTIIQGSEYNYLAIYNSSAESKYYNITH